MPGLYVVMAGFMPAIHVFLNCTTKGVDARHKAGHDERRRAHDEVQESVKSEDE